MPVSRPYTQKFDFRWPGTVEIKASQLSTDRSALTKTLSCPICTYQSQPRSEVECQLCGGIVTLAAIDLFATRHKKPSFLLHTCTRRMHRDYRAGDPDYFRDLGLAYLNLGWPSDALFQLFLARRCGSADPYLDYAIRTLENWAEIKPS